MKKNPWLAAILNVLISGVGYIYVGKRVLFGVLLLISDLIVYYFILSDANFSKNFLNGPVILCGLIVTAAFALDGYNDAKIVNRK